MWLTLGLCLQWAHHISLWVQGNELKNAQEALPPLRTEAHGLLQAMAFKAERRNTTWEAHSQHTDGKEGKKKRKPCFVSPREKIRDCCPLSIYTEQHSAYKSKYHGMGDHLHAYQPCFLTTDSHLSKPRTDGSTSTDGTQYKCLLSLYPNLIRYQKKKNYIAHYHLEIEWMTMHSYSCYPHKEVERENTSYSSTQTVQIVPEQAK